MKIPATIYLFSVLLYPILCHAQQDSILRADSLNYTQNFKMVTTNNLLQGWDTNVKNAAMAIEYYDGFGRLKQKIAPKGSPHLKDLIYFEKQDYDSMHLQKAYLPYVSQIDRRGNIESDPISAQEAYYGSPSAVRDANPYPYSITRLTRSPFAEVVEQGGIGAEWQPLDVSISGSGHTQKIGKEYVSYSAENVVYWRLTNNGIAPDTPPSLSVKNSHLTKTTVRPVDWQGGHAGTTVTYMDVYGHTVLSRTYLSDTVSADIYYIHDGTGRLRYVLPPGIPVQAITDTVSVYDHIYVYGYNGKGQLSSVKTPQKEVVYHVYDKTGRAVLSQDALLRTRNEWSYVKYDVHGRSALSGVFLSISDQTTLQAILDTASYTYEEPNAATTTGYTDRIFPHGDTYPWNIQYYDHYSNLPSGHPRDLLSTDSSCAEVMIGYPIASRQKYADSNDYLWSTIYYDQENKVSAEIFSTVLGGVDTVRYMYDLDDRVMQITSIHRISPTALFTENRRFDYNHLGMVTREYYRANTEPEVLQYSYTYDDLGNLARTFIHSTDSGQNYAQHIDLQYSKIGLLRKINASDSIGSKRLFAMQLYHEDGDIPTYTGHISQVRWNSVLDGPEIADAPKKIRYLYDATGRLLQTHTFEDSVRTDKYAERFSYDIRGNITKLVRHAGVGGSKALIDSLHYIYHHNQLHRLDDASGHVLGFSEQTQKDNEYVYNSNGDLVSDGNKDIQRIGYNRLGLVDTVVWSGPTSRKLIYSYLSSGQRYSKKYIVDTDTMTWLYVGNKEYEKAGGSPTLKLVHYAGGRLRVDPSMDISYEYDLTDHQGNTRITFDIHNGEARLKQSTGYYAFGSSYPGPATEFVSGGKNLYLYNGKELQEETDWYDYPARMYDPVIGRWMVQDPMSTSYYGYSPYGYVLNNPINYTDPTGMYHVQGGRGQTIIDLMGQSDPVRYAEVTGPGSEAWYYGQMAANADFLMYGLPEMFAQWDRNSNYYLWQSILRNAGVKWSPHDHANSDYKLVTRKVGIAVGDGEMSYSYVLRLEQKAADMSMAEMDNMKLKANGGLQTALGIVGNVNDGVSGVTTGLSYNAQNGNKLYIGTLKPSPAYGFRIYAKPTIQGVVGSSLAKSSGYLGIAVSAATVAGTYAEEGYLGQQTKVATAQALTGWAGAWAGAKIGAAAGGIGGSFVPILGNGVGAIAGGIVGGIIGGIGGGWIAGKVYEY